MGRILVMLSISLDGLIADADGSLAWHRVDEELHAEFNDVLRGCGAFLEGRVMFEMMNAYWPTADQDPTAGPAEVEFAQLWRETPKLVFSRDPDYDTDDATVVRQVVPAEVRRLLDEHGDLSLGGADIAQEFMRHGLVDELRLYVHPVVLGSGKRLFADAPTELALQECRSFGSGVVLLRYGRV
jgi:dihydrofolate reductase